MQSTLRLYGLPVLMAAFLRLLGVVFFVVTTTILLVVPEEPDQNPADRSSVLVTYQNVVCVSCLPAVRTLLLCLLTFKVMQCNNVQFIENIAALRM